MKRIILAISLLSIIGTAQSYTGAGGFYYSNPGMAATTRAIENSNYMRQQNAAARSQIELNRMLIEELQAERAARLQLEAQQRREYQIDALDREKQNLLKKVTWLVKAKGLTMAQVEKIDAISSGDVWYKTAPGLRVVIHLLENDRIDELEKVRESYKGRVAN